MNVVPKHLSHLSVRRLEGPLFEELYDKESVWKRIQEHKLKEKIPLEATIRKSDRAFVNGIRLNSDKLQSHFIHQMIKDYERYMLILRLVDGEFLPPTLAVDYVWHAHLEHPEHYYDSWCAQVLKKLVLHHPGIGTESEIVEGYRRFRKYYFDLFKELPTEEWGLSQASGALEVYRFEPVIQTKTEIVYRTDPFQRNADLHMGDCG